MYFFTTHSGSVTGSAKMMMMTLAIFSMYCIMMSTAAESEFCHLSEDDCPPKKPDPSRPVPPLPPPYIILPLPPAPPTEDPLCQIWDINPENTTEICCEACPIGQRRTDKRCGVDRKGMCTPCEAGSYSEDDPNYSKACFKCDTCMNGIQIVRGKCETTRNTICMCVGGYDCYKDIPCRHCRKDSKLFGFAGDVSSSKNDPESGKTTTTTTTSSSSSSSSTVTKTTTSNCGEDE